MLAQFYPPTIGGEENHVRNLARIMHDRGHHVEVLTTAPGASAQRTVVDRGVAVHYVRTSAQRLPWLYTDQERPHALPLPDPAMARAVEGALANRRFDVVHAHNWIVNSALGPAKRSGVPLVLTLHDYSHVCAVKRLMLRGAVCPGPGPLRCTLCAADHYGPVVGIATAGANGRGRRARNDAVAAFVSVSDAVARHNGLPPDGERSFVVPNFVADSLVDPHAPPRPDGPVLFVGDVMPDKGIDVLVEAFRLLGSSLRLRIVGRGVPGVELALPPGTRLLGPRSHDEVVAEMRAARLVVVPSVWADPCPTVVLEAMALARPVVGTRVGGITDMVADGVTGRLVAPGDAVALAAAIGEIAGRSDVLASYGSAGVARVGAFTASRVAAELEGVYERVARWAPAVPA